MTKTIKHDCESCGSRHKGLFCSLGSSELGFLNDAKVDQKFKPGDYLFYAGNLPMGVYCISNGTIKLESLDVHGKSHMIQVYGPGSILGYRALFSNEPYVSSAIAAEETEICFIPKTVIFDLVRKDPDLAIKFLSKLSNDFRMVEQRLQRLTTRSAGERIAEALLFLRENFNDKNWTRKEISEWASTTPETVIRTLADFESEGIIEQKGRSITILNRERLLEKANISS